ncbi:hypothetical protein As57867_006536, partial [Aphanomyces stellatus]
MTANGAIYLDSVLRNIPFDAFLTCWGAAFEPAVAYDLRQSVDGRAWLAATSSSVKLPVSDEVTVWTSHGIAMFVTQWQNFKHLGLVHTYAVETAMGTSHSFTIQHQEGRFRLREQTTFKIYWGLANDLMALASNQTSSATSWPAGRSLLRASPNFAFANATPTTLLIQNGTLVAPFVSSFSVLVDV